MNPNFSKICGKIKKTIFKNKLHKIINDRDNFAHGSLEFDLKNGKVFLKYYKDGIQRQEIDQAYLDDLHDTLETIYEQLATINTKIFQKYADGKE